MCLLVVLLPDTIHPKRVMHDDIVEGILSDGLIDQRGTAPPISQQGQKVSKTVHQY